MLKNIVVKNRSYRRFNEDVHIDRDTLCELLDLARLAPSGGNKQPLKYFLANTKEVNALIFPHLAWAGYLKDWHGPEEGERPSAYIIILGDKSIAQDFDCDLGIAAQTIMLGAAEKGIGGCMIRGFNPAKLSKQLNIPEQFEVQLVLALGKPKEEVKIENVGSDGSIKYWRDEHMVHHVPKRSLDEIVLN